MKLISCSAQNFGCFKDFSLNFNDLGLTLLAGRTGSGKSTIADMVFWALFGETAKGGNVDEVRSWTNPGDPTQVILSLETPNGIYSITRVRGTASQNDLSWSTEAQRGCTRGKDLADSQKLLVATLGFDSESYIAAAYFNEYAPSGSFFSTNSKNQRALLERLCDLSSATALAVHSTARKSEYRKALDGLENRIGRVSTAVEVLGRGVASALSCEHRWNTNNEHSVRGLKIKYHNFEETKAKNLKEIEAQSKAWEAQKEDQTKVLVERIEAMPEPELSPDKCPTCGTQQTSAHRDWTQQISKLMDKLEVLRDHQNPHTRQIKLLQESVNTYAEQLAAAEATENPHTSEVLRLQQELTVEVTKLALLEKDASGLKQGLSDLGKLYDLSFDLRGLLLTNLVTELSHTTNYYLSTFFDSEVKVELALSGADSISVTLQKSGHECVYRQLSKGQRALLKLAFAVSVMKAASNKCGVQFENLFLDEALDGLDTELKLKAFSLFEELAAGRQSVLVIDHSEELKAMFHRTLQVTMDADVSKISEEI